jgi:hypothetical protein
MLATKIKFFKIVLFYLHVSMSLLKVTPKLDCLNAATWLLIQICVGWKGESGGKIILNSYDVQQGWPQNLSYKTVYCIKAAFLLLKNTYYFHLYRFSSCCQSKYFSMRKKSFQSLLLIRSENKQ